MRGWVEKRGGREGGREGREGGRTGVVGGDELLHNGQEVEVLLSMGRRYTHLSVAFISPFSPSLPPSLPPSFSPSPARRH